MAVLTAAGWLISSYRTGLRYPWTNRWDHVIDVSQAPVSFDDLVLYVEEIKWGRPASYPAEPLPKTKLTDPSVDLFVPSGPKFMDRFTFGDAGGSAPRWKVSMADNPELQTEEFLK